MPQKKQTTTRALGATTARWIMQARCGVMAFVRGELSEITCVPSHGSSVAVLDDNGKPVPVSLCRIHRDTVQQIKQIIAAGIG